MKRTTMKCKLQEGTSIFFVIMSDMATSTEISTHKLIFIDDTFHLMFKPSYFVDEYWFWKSLTNTFLAGSFYASLVIQSSQTDKRGQVKVIIKQSDLECQQERF